jgi:hypothetical protein
MLGLLAALVKSPLPSAVYLYPLCVLLPSWMVFFDKATTIARIVGYYRVIEGLMLNQLRAASFPGWENALRGSPSPDARPVEDSSGNAAGNVAAAGQCLSGDLQSKNKSQVLGRLLLHILYSIRVLSCSEPCGNRALRCQRPHSWWRCAGVDHSRRWMDRRPCLAAHPRPPLLRLQRSILEEGSRHLRPAAAISRQFWLSPRSRSRPHPSPRVLLLRSIALGASRNG